MRNHKSVSIKDVAAASGVSVATVSRIINNSGRYSADTKRKVDEVIAKIGYEKNKLAVSLRSNESKMVGILVPDITNEFFATVVKECEQLLFLDGYASIICNTERSAQREREYIQVLSEHRVDGLIIISAQKSGASSENHVQIPIVYIDREPESENDTVVQSDHYDGGVQATQYLLDCGLDPYLVMTKTESSATLDRVRGFRDVLIERGYSEIDSRIFKLNLTSDQFLKAAPMLDAFLRKVSTEPNIGIFGINDNVAFMVLRAAKTLHLRVPDDISVIGYDGTLYSEIASPQLTTIAQDTSAIAEKATGMLTSEMRQRISGAPIKAEILSIPVTLVKRQSTPGVKRGQK